MFDNSVVSLICSSALLGITLHWTWFINGEHHTYPWSIVRTALLVCLTCLVILHDLLDYSWYEAMKLLAYAHASFYLSLFASIVHYRTFCHPLRAFPGPPLARISKLWHIWLIRDVDNYWQIHKLHQQHGSIIRIGQFFSAFTGPSLTAYSYRS